MPGIADYIEESQIVFLEVETRDGALHQLVDVLDQAGKLREKRAFYKAIVEREKIVSTGIGLGVAIPHAKLEGYPDFFIAIGIQKKRGIEWNSLDGAVVRLVFMIGGPDNRQTDYLKILSTLTTAIKNNDLRKKLLEVDTPKQIKELFQGY